MIKNIKKLNYNSDILNKTGTEINTYIKNLIDNNEDYKEEIENLINHKIDELDFIMI